MAAASPKRRACSTSVDFIIGTFSKSVGTVGGFCVSNHPKFEILRLVCRPYVFTASLPPSVVATAATSIRKLMHGADKRAHLWENSKKLHAGLKALGFTLGTDTPQSAIIAVIMPDLEKGAMMWEALLNEGLYVNLARPPATPGNMTLLRCSLCAEHSSDAGRPNSRHVRRGGTSHGLHRLTRRTLSLGRTGRTRTTGMRESGDERHIRLERRRGGGDRLHRHRSSCSAWSSWWHCPTTPAKPP